MSDEIVRVTPVIAEAWLRRNAEDNRRRDPVRVAEIAVALEERRWAPDVGQPIEFDADGRLVNGQHRLAAVVESDEATRFRVVWKGDPR